MLFSLSRFLSVLIITIFLLIIMFLVLSPIFSSNSIIFPYSFTPFNITQKYPTFWKYCKLSYIISYTFSVFLLTNSILSIIFKKENNSESQIDFNTKRLNNNEINLLVGSDSINNQKIYIPQKGLFQNVLITGTTGSGKTSSAMYPFTKQIISFNHNDISKKIGILVLDVKGNYFKQVKEYAKIFNRENDLIVIEIGEKVKYNPLHKPNLKASVLANRLKTILTLFSSNNTDSYWLDKAEQVLTECIKFCRLYNNNYVTFEELHKLITISDYYISKINYLKQQFQKNILTTSQIYDLSTSLDFFQKEFSNLDSRVLSILKSEITRITGTFVNDYDILKTFSPKEYELNFYGFKQLILEGKIVILNMNIAEYRQLSKIIATYLKLDFQYEVLSTISSNIPKRITAFISDEFHEYITSTDADFFALSREANCINIVASQSYTSLLNTLKDANVVRTIIQNLVNKLWFRTDDTFTIEDAQKQLGKEDKVKTSKTISENAAETNFNYLTNTLNSKKSNISESISTYFHSDYIFDTNYFTQNLEIFSCLSFLSDGRKILHPTKVKMQPYFESEQIIKNYKKNNLLD